MAILATSLFNMAICLFNAMASMGTMMTPLSSTPLPTPSPPSHYTPNQMQEKYDTIQSNPAASASLASPSASVASHPSKSTAATASEIHALDSGADGFDFLFPDQFDLESLVTQSVLGINPFFLLLFSPLFLLLISRQPSKTPSTQKNPRVPMPGFAAAADAVGHPVRSLESLLQDPIFNSSQPFLKPI